MLKACIHVQGAKLTGAGGAPPLILAYRPTVFYQRGYIRPTEIGSGKKKMFSTPADLPPYQHFHADGRQTNCLPSLQLALGLGLHRLVIYFTSLTVPGNLVRPKLVFSRYQ